MEKKPFFKKVKEVIEKILPMTIGSFFLFVVVLYLLFTVGRSVWVSYQSNQDIDLESEKAIALESEINYMKNQIAYYKTNTYREKQAREKLGFIAPGERALALPVDEPEDKVLDTTQSEVKIKTPNYRLWWIYFFGG